MYAYQLAVVVDDVAMGVTEVVRGIDLLDSTARQIYLFEKLGAAPPAFAHVGLALYPDGGRIAKRDAGSSLAEIRAASPDARPLVGRLARSLGIIDREEPISAAELVPLFRWTEAARNEWRVW
jgi:glutamyl-tRNA synthetase